MGVRPEPGCRRHRRGLNRDQPRPFCCPSEKRMADSAVELLSHRQRTGTLPRDAEMGKTSESRLSTSRLEKKRDPQAFIRKFPRSRPEPRAQINLQYPRRRSFFCALLRHSVIAQRLFGSGSIATLRSASSPRGGPGLPLLALRLQRSSAGTSLLLRPLCFTCLLAASRSAIRASRAWFFAILAVSRSPPQVPRPPRESLWQHGLPCGGGAALTRSADQGT